MQESKVETQEDDECQICYEKYTSMLRRPIECHACFQKCCSSCVTYYLLNTTGNATCMFKNCNKTWSDNYIFETLGKSTYSKFRDFKLEQLYQKEKSLVPKTQIKIQNKKEAERITQKIRSTESLMYHFDIMFRIVDSLKKYNKISGDHSLINTENEVVLRNKLSCYSQDIIKLNAQKNKLISGSVKDKLKFIRNCGKSECKGLLSTKWICGTCKTKFCKECGEEKGVADDSEMILDETEEDEGVNDGINEGVNEVVNEGVVESKQEGKQEGKQDGKQEGDKSTHICNPDLVETMKAIRKETKACPKCGINIFKIQGCDQMWCINCHSAFDWNTRKI